MSIAAAVFFMLHGIAHLVGFVVPWKLANMEDAPYKTTIFADRIDLGDTGIRIMGIGWLLLALAFVAAGVAALLGVSWWPLYTVIVAAVSLVFSILGVPEAKLGVPINIVILAVILWGMQAGWNFI